MDTDLESTAFWRTGAPLLWLLTNNARPLVGWTILVENKNTINLYVSKPQSVLLTITGTYRASLPVPDSETIFQRLFSGSVTRTGVLPGETFMGYARTQSVSESLM